MDSGGRTLAALAASAAGGDFDLDLYRLADEDRAADAALNTHSESTLRGKRKKHSEQTFVVEDLPPPPLVKVAVHFAAAAAFLERGVKTAPALIDLASLHDRALPLLHNQQPAPGSSGRGSGAASRFVRAPFVALCLAECSRMNRLLAVLRDDLRCLRAALIGGKEDGHPPRVMLLVSCDQRKE